MIIHETRNSVTMLDAQQSSGLPHQFALPLQCRQMHQTLYEPSLGHIIKLSLGALVHILCSGVASYIYVKLYFTFFSS